jgi:hypothetical protein
MIGKTLAALALSGTGLIGAGALEHVGVKLAFHIL